MLRARPPAGRLTSCGDRSWLVFSSITIAIPISIAIVIAIVILVTVVAVGAIFVIVVTFRIVVLNFIIRVGQFPLS